MKRILLFLLTNLLVMITISITLNIVMMFLGVHNISGYYTPLMVFCLVWGMGGAFISLLLSKWTVKMAMGVQLIDKTVTDLRLRNLYNTVEKLARKAGIDKTPEVGVYESPDMNAFATGPSKNSSLVAVSTGLLSRMNDDEIEGVIGHELAHVANGDMVTMTLIQGVVNSFAMFLSRVIAAVALPSDRDRNPVFLRYMLTIALDIAFTALGSIIVFYFSRQREYRADAGGAEFAGKSKMLAGLKKLKAELYGNEEEQKDNFATLKISGRPKAKSGIFSTHPSLDERIARLEGRLV